MSTEAVDRTKQQARDQKTISQGLGRGKKLTFFNLWPDTGMLGVDCFVGKKKLAGHMASRQSFNTPSWTCPVSIVKGRWEYQTSLASQTETARALAICGLK